MQPLSSSLSRSSERTVSAARFAVAVVLLFSSAAHGAVLTGPLNDAVVAGEDVSFTCFTTATGAERIQFFEFTTNQGGSIITDGENILPGHPNLARYRLNADASIGFYELKVTPTVVADGGRYACVDANQLPAPVFYSANLVVFVNLPNCTTTLPPGNDLVVMGYYTCECSAFYQSSYQVRPTGLWTGPGEYTHVVTNTNVSTWIGMAFYALKGMEGRSYDCLIDFDEATFNFTDGTTATNVPTFSYLFTTGPMNIIYSPRNQTYYPVQQSYEIGQVLTCWADASPPPTYEWTNVITQEKYPSQTVTLLPSMVGVVVLRCQAINSVGSADLFVNITVNPITTTTPTPSTTPTTAIPPSAPCDPIDGRWESVRDDGTTIALCFFYDPYYQNLYGLVQNTTNDPFVTDSMGVARTPDFSDFAVSTLYAASGVGAFAGECRRCYGTEYMFVNGISRRSSDAVFCGTGSDLINSPTMTFFRVPTSPPCPATRAAWKSYLIEKNYIHKTPNMKRP